MVAVARFSVDVTQRFNGNGKDKYICEFWDITLNDSLQGRVIYYVSKTQYTFSDILYAG